MINPEFVKALERNRGQINAAFEFNNSGDSHVESSEIFSALARVMVPLFDKQLTVTDNNVVSIFKGLLKLLSKRLIGNSSRDKELENNFYRIIDKHNSLLSEHGGSFLLEVFNALLNLKEKKLSSAGRWSEIISDLPVEIDRDTFRKCGFIAAWICGAASARETAAEIILSVDPEIIRLIFSIETFNNKKPEDLSGIINKNPWSNPVSFLIDKHEISPVFKTAGGFTGYGYVFRRVPAVSAIHDIFYATDGTDVFRIYADFYGVELIRDSAVKPEMIQPGGVINRFVKGRDFVIDKHSYPLPAEWKNNITSIAFNADTVIWTLADSYKIYIAGVRG